MMNKTILLLLLLIVTGAVQAKNIYLVRHAEKIEDGSKDPQLTLSGQLRAQNIAKMLSSANISQIYSTDYQRTQMTARPLAEYLNLEIKSYDPRKLPDFATDLKTQSGNVLVVGHSNTTPMLTHLLSGKPTFSLDEVQYDNVFQVSIENENSTVTVLKSIPSQVTDKLDVIEPLNDHFFSGKLTFNMHYQDKFVGKSVHQFEQSNLVYEIKEKTTIEEMNIDANIQVNVEKETLSPLSMVMTGHMGGPVDINLKWQDSLLSGYSSMARAPFKNQGKIQFDDKTLPASYERTSLILLAHLMPVTESQPLWINWFDAYDGEQRLIEIEYLGEEQVTVPAGTFETYKIHYSGGAPSQYFWIDKNQSKVIKIDVVKSPWHYELVEFKIND